MPFAASPRTLKILAPARVADIEFGKVRVDDTNYNQLLKGMQQLRGRIYLDDHAIQPQQLTKDGRHKLDSDETSWHLLILDEAEQVCGCVRYREHPEEAGFSHLGVARSALAQCGEWGPKLATAVSAELALARRLAISYVEVGGWALKEQIRNTGEALRMVLATYSLAQALGGGVGLSTATRRHSSASILRKLGGRSLEERGVELPAYFDPEYGCEMEILRFYSWAPNPRYHTWVEAIREELKTIPVVTRKLQSHVAVSRTPEVIRDGAGVCGQFALA